MVSEFYVNVPSHLLKMVTIQGKIVSFDVSTINDFYGLDNMKDEAEYERLKANPNYEKIIDKLMNKKGAWKLNNSNEIVNFWASFLTPRSIVWHNFISAKLLPTLNTSEVTKKQAILNFSIQKELSIDVGWLIERPILTTMEEKKTNFDHSSYIC